MRFRSNQNVIVASALIALLVAGCSQKPESMVASAKEYIAKSDGNAAIIQLKNALQADPNLAEARLLLGRSQLAIGEVQAAEKELRRALELKVDIAQVAPPLAEAMVRLGQFSRVLEEFGKVDASDPADQAQLKTALGRAELALGRRDAAEGSFALALKAKPGYGPALLGQAYLKVAASDLPGALATIEEAIAKDGKSVEARQLKGDLLVAQGHKDQAIVAYREALALRPDFLPAHSAIISILSVDGKVEDAGKQLEAMQKAAPNHPQTKYLGAVFAMRQKNLPAARDAIQAVLQVAPENLPAMTLAGAIEFELKNYAQAEAMLQKVLLRQPQQAYARRVLAATYLRERQPAKALETIKPLLDGKIEDPGLLGLAGEVYILNGDADEAARYFQRAAEIDPKSTNARTALALAHMVKGETERAFGELEATAAADTGTRADLALIAMSIRSRDFDKAMRAIDALEQKQPDNPMAHNLRGSVLLAKRDKEGARRSFEKALAIDKGYLPAAANLARLDVADKKPDEAKRRFEGALEKDPKNSAALLSLAELRAAAGGAPSEVAALVEKAVAANPKDANARVALVGVHLRNQDTKRAIAAARDGLAAIPDSVELLNALGRAQLAAGDLDGALVTFGKFAQLQPSSPIPWVRIAEVQVQQRNTDAAVQSLRKSLSIRPGLLDAQVALMRLEVARGKHKEALVIARDVQKQRPGQASGWMLEGDIHMAQKAWHEAIAAYRAALKLAPGQSEAGAKLHTALNLSGNRGEADRFAATWHKEHPNDGLFRRYLAAEAMGRRDLSTALRYYKEALAITPNDPALLNNTAWVAGQLKDPKAIEYAELANKFLPDNPAIMDTLGALLVEKGEGQRGVDLLKRAVDGAPKSASIRLNYARGLLRTGQRDAARKELEALQVLGDKFDGQAEVATLMQQL